MGMTERDKRVLAAVLALVVLGGYWFLVLGKKRNAIKEAEAAQLTAQADLATAKASEDAALKVAKVKPVAYSRLLRLGKAIPADADFESLLVQVNDLSVRSKVSFISLSAANGTGAAGSGATGSTTCEEGASGASGAAPASPATGASGATGSTAESGFGKARDNAKGAVAESQQNAAAKEAASKAVDCADSPSLTDIAATAAGLQTESFTFTFTGSFYDLRAVYNGLLDLVKVRNARVSVTGRLLDINSISMAVGVFPMLTSSVSMTGYKLPVASASNGTELNATATTPEPAASTTPAQ